jgi:uncharacterized membrane protein
MQGGLITEGPVTKVNVGRLTNGIFGFSFLLIFFRLPEVRDYAGNPVIVQYLLTSWSAILDFANLFLILALIWVIMFYIFHEVAWIDRTFLYLHSLLLMLVIFIPVTYSISLVEIVVHPVVLHLNMLAIGLVLVLEWLHCQKKPVLLKAGIPKTGIPTCTRISLLIIPLTAVAGCVLAGLNFPSIQYIYIAAVLIVAITSTWMLDNRKKTRSVMFIPTEVAPAVATYQKTHVVEGIVPHEMLEMLINAIFAFSLTLIIRSPIKQIIEDPVAGSAVFHEINKMTYGINFLFIFMTLMVFYILFFEIMQNTRVNDWIVVYFSFGFILSILFIPLTTILWTISDRPDYFSLTAHINILIAGLLMVFLWRHISTDPVLCVPGTDTMFRNLSLRLLLFPVTAIAGLFLDWWPDTFNFIPLGSLYIIPVVLFVYLSRDSKTVVEAKPAET